MSKKPPRADRRVNGDISVDLRTFLSELSRALDWDAGSQDLGSPGSYESVGCSDTPDRFAVNYLFQEIMSKFDDGDMSKDKLREHEALVKFDQAEKLCAETNERISKWHLQGAFLRDCDPDVALTLVRAREKLRTWLGPFDWDEAAQGFEFTHGASAMKPRTVSTPAHKYSGEPEITYNAATLLSAALLWNPAWGASLTKEPAFTPGNRLLCVPKNYKVHRVIAAEPSLNMFFQKGIGTALRRRLKAVGVDLRSQVMNQDFALLGSKSGLVATIDLSMASDTVSSELVEWAIPPDWVEAMSLCRSPFGVLPSGSKVLYRKWSSMGNAYTFELETSLFLAIVHAACDISGHDRRFATVYGDDIICPTGAADLVIRTLREAGFVPNEKKSFVRGPFRESCGKHFFSGHDVSPFYIRKPLTRLTDLFLLLNNLRRWIWRTRDFLPDHQVEAVEALARRWRSYAPSQWRRPRIPDGVGDGAFIGTFDECQPSRPKGKYLWFEGWQVEVMTETPVNWSRVPDKSLERLYKQLGIRHLSDTGLAQAMLHKLSRSKAKDLLGDDLVAESEVIPTGIRRWTTTTLIVAQY